MTRRRAPALVVAAIVALSGCSGSTSGATGGSPSGRSAAGVELGGTLTVFAAASLTDVFPELGTRLEEENPQLDVRFNFAGSSALATQITQGAPADVFASAAVPQMDVVSEAGLAADAPQLFAANVPQIAVPAGNPAGVTGPADFGREELTLALCAPQVPCGAAANQVFEAAGISPVPDTLEEDVRAALTKVELGEVDAALVYATDVTAAGSAVEGIDIPGADAAASDYPIATLAGAPNPAAARAFVDLVLSDRGRRALLAAGFLAP